MEKQTTMIIEKKTEESYLRRYTNFQELSHKTKMNIQKRKHGIQKYIFQEISVEHTRYYVTSSKTMNINKTPEKNEKREEKEK